MSDKRKMNIFARSLVLRNPSVSTEEARGEWLKAGGSPAKFHKDVVPTARYLIKHKYAVKDVKQLPRTSGGDPDAIGLIKLLAASHPGMTIGQAKNWLAQDGVKLTQAEWDEATAGASPDPNRDAGPRAGQRGERKTRKDKGKPRRDRDLAQRYLDMEGALDDLVQKARELMDGKLVEDIRAVRRAVIIKAANLV